MAAIEVSDLCRTYRTHVGIVRRRRTDVQALAGISFEVERGELSGLLGTEVLVGGSYLVLGIVLLRVLEFQGRRSATLETF